MAEIVIAVAGKVSEYLVAPIGRQLGYLFCYRSHAEKLRNQVQTLRTARNDQQITVDEATRKGDEIRPAVGEWLNRVDQITEEAEAFVLMRDDQNMSCLNGWCPNLISRYQFGREAYKKAQVIVGIQIARNFPDGISYSVPPRSATFKGYECFQSRDSTLNDIMDALRDDKTKMIGVCGMGGLGKTMLVKQVAQQAKQDNLFTTFIFIDVSFTRDSKKDEEGIAKIQQKTAEMLGFQFKGKDESTRADELKQRLQKKKEPEKDKESKKENQPEKEKEQKKEKILIILDDIWKEINLEKVGIPFKDDQTICKLVLVSRDTDILRKDMGTQKCFQIQHLQGEEAWCLLKKIAGDSVEGDQLQPTAIKVLDECGGLPIAIVTIATALKDESVAVWENALDELRSCAPTNIRGMEKKVYTCLQWSYNHLEGDEVKSLFVLCGCLSYYGDISMDQMLWYAMGLDFFNDFDSLEKARNKLVTLVKTLKASSLLLDGTEDDGNGSGVGASSLLFMDGDHKSVKMHDLVCDVARIIASKDPHQFKVVKDVSSDQDWTKIEDESKFISLYCKAVLELPPRLVCPKLQFFILQNNSGASLNTIPNTFFEGMNQLKVLVLSRMHFPILPSTCQSLTNLRTLCLERCKLGDMAIIGELKKLKVLSMVGSDIQQLPREMMQLTNLRLLDLNYCEKLKVIPRDILSSLSRLECLFMKSSFSEWAVEEVCDGDRNVCLSELNNLHRLRTIELKIPNAELVPKADMFDHNLTSYAIFIGSFDPWQETYEKSKTLHLKGGDESLLCRDGIRKLLRTTEDLLLRGLEVCGGPIPIRSFDNLKTLVVRECHALKILFLLSMARDLPQLEEMTIEDCDEMQQIMEDGHVGINLQLLFPKLRSLKLRYLPKLVNFGYFRSELETTSEAMCSQGNLNINMPFFNYQALFSNLEILQLYELPKIKEIWHHQLPLDSFSNLRILRVEWCRQLFNLIPCHLIQSFKNLKEIEVGSCENLRHVFEIFSKPEETSKLDNLVEPKGISMCDNEKNESSGGCFSCFSHFSPIKRSSIFYPRKEEKDQGNVNISKQDGVHFLGEEIWHHQLSRDSFSNLRILRVEDCRSLLNIIPCHLIQSFKNLKEINVSWCWNLKHVFDLQGCDTYGEILPKLEILELEYLNELQGIICNNEENDDTRGLFSPSMPMSFQNLKCLSINNCGEKVEEHEVLFGEKVSFPNLEELKLDDLSMLKKIWHPQHKFSDKLRILSVRTCPRLANLIPSHLIHNFQNLEELDVYNCEVLEYVFDHQGLNRDDGILPKIEVLKLQKLPNLRLTFYEDKNDNMPYHFSLFKFTASEHIKELHIINCGKPLDEKVSFSPNLEVLVLERFFNLKKIDFGTEPKLRKLMLKNLPKLSNIRCNGDENAFFPFQKKEPKSSNILPFSMLKNFHLEENAFSRFQKREPELSKILSSSAFKNFSNLKELDITDCGMEEDEIYNERYLKTNERPQVSFLNHKVSFYTNERLKLGNQPKLKDKNIA